MQPNKDLNLSLALFLSSVKDECLSIASRGRVQQGISTVPVSLASPRESAELIVVQTGPILPFLL